MKFNRNKWWGKHGRFRRQMMVLYGRVQKEDAVLNMSVVIPINLTIAIVIGHLVIMWGLFNVGVIRNFILMLAGVWAFYGIIVAARRTKALEKQVHIQEQGQVADSLARAVEQLSSKVMAVRILAIVSLRKIALGADMKMCGDIIEVLCAYAREKNKSPMQEDTRKAVIVLGHIKKNMKWDIHMDLSKINLSGANLKYVNLPGVDLQDADLSGADLRVANLSGANLRDANLSRANLSSADLSGATLLDVNLSDADLQVANLSGANLLRANLLEVSLWDANLQRANLSGADLSSADLSSADLRSSHLSGANLQRAHLLDANLSDANLQTADLSGANLSSVNLSCAILWMTSLSEVKGLDTVKNLETVKWQSQEIIDEIARRKQEGEK